MVAGITKEGLASGIRRDPSANVVLRLQTMFSDGRPGSDFSGFLFEDSRGRYFLVTAFHCLTKNDLYPCHLSEDDKTKLSKLYPDTILVRDYGIKARLFDEEGKPTFFWHADPEQACIDLAAIPIKMEAQLPVVNRIGKVDDRYAFVEGMPLTTGTPGLLVSFPFGNVIQARNANQDVVPVSYAISLAADYFMNPYYFVINGDQAPGCSGGVVFARREANGLTNYEWIGVYVAHLGKRAGWESNLGRCMPKKLVNEMTSGL